MKTDRSGFLTHRAVLVVLALVFSITTYLVGNSLMNASRVQPKQPAEVVSPEPVSLEDEAATPETSAAVTAPEIVPSIMTLEDILKQNDGVKSDADADVMALKFEVKPIAPQTSWWPAHSHEIHGFMIPQE